MKNKVSLNVLVFFLFSGEVFSQVANYVFSQSIGPYITITPNTNASSTGVVPSWSGTNGANTEIENIGLPFPICFNGTTYTAVSMHHNGYIQFATSTPTTNNPLSGALNNTVSVFGADLETGGSSSMGVRISGVQIGTAPFRYIIFQWGPGTIGASWWRRVGYTNDQLHFQIRLYETSNVIEFRYYIPQARPSSAVTGVEVGLRGASASDFNVRTMSSNVNWHNNNSAGTAIGNQMLFGNGTVVKPNHNVTGQTGLIFRWVPPNDPLSAPTSSTCYNPLPVELYDFQAHVEKNQNRIEWVTTSEVNSDYFIVERSLNGGEWDRVGTVKSAGNSNVLINYELVDNSFESTINYYRLTQVDFDGTSKIYNMIYADNRTCKPNLVKIIDLMGKEVNEDTKGFVIELYSDGSSKKYFRE